ncbi:unnamed protein product [Clavelina lepadiformis]|uniref:Uncharacterized protein n=1 Tax=Clavelina lepadiformis TaxID=159417 RepID=A0ABP0GLZ9_CLALP
MFSFTFICTELECKLLQSDVIMWQCSRVKQNGIIFLALISFSTVLMYNYQQADSFIYPKNAFRHHYHRVQGFENKSDQIENLRDEKTDILKDESPRLEEDFGQQSSDEGEKEFMTRMRERMDDR